MIQIDVVGGYYYGLSPLLVELSCFSLPAKKVWRAIIVLAKTLWRSES